MSCVVLLDHDHTIVYSSNDQSEFVTGYNLRMQFDVLLSLEWGAVLHSTEYLRGCCLLLPNHLKPLFVPPALRVLS